jgi:hypothetical protein
VNVKVNVDSKERKRGKKKNSNSGLKKLVIAGVVTALISLGVYYVKNQMGKSGSPAIINGR